MYYLMIKRHNKTGLKYLCQTRRKDPYLYPGSGKYWKLHLEKHGYDITTEVIGQYQTKEELREAGLHYSNQYKVTESGAWANLVVESGDGGRTADTIGYKEGMKKRRSYVGQGNPQYGKTGYWSSKVGPMVGKKWYNNGTEEELIAVRPEGWLDGRIKKTCEHCNKQISNMNYKRYHGEKCKLAQK
jgi:hypothetical protein